MKGGVVVAVVVGVVVLAAGLFFVLRRPAVPTAPALPAPAPPAPVTPPPAGGGKGGWDVLDSLVKVAVPGLFDAFATANTERAA